MSKVKFLVTMLVLALFIAGCGTKQAQDTKEPAPKLGIIDISQAVKAHPKYKQFMALEQQADAIAMELETQQSVSLQQSQSIQTIPDMTEKEMTELNKTFEQEFNTKMAAKQEELSPRLVAKADVIRHTVSAELDAYNEQLDKKYQPQIFNLQLKLKTVQLTKEETTALQSQLEKVQTERSEAQALKQKQLVQRMDELIAPEKAAIEQQLADYAKQLNAEISKKAAAKQAEIMSRNTGKLMPTVQTPQTDQVSSKKQQQLALKQQEIQALQELILKDITEKTGKVATEDGFEAVLTNVTVNISAVDITAKVIAECNK